MDISTSSTQLGLSLSSNLTWKTHIHSLAKHAPQKLCCLARAHGFFSSSHLLAICKSQIKVQSKAICLINNPNLTKSLQPLSHRRLIEDLSIMYRCFDGHCSQEIREIIPVPPRHVRTNRSSTHSHPFQVLLPNPQTIPQIIIQSFAFFLLPLLGLCIHNSLRKRKLSSLNDLTLCWLSSE